MNVLSRMFFTTDIKLILIILSSHRIKILFENINLLFDRDSVAC